jgi:hypothetical protein
MSRHDDPVDPDHQMESEAVSSDRPPQFNGSNCGYRCGWGCCEPRGGDDDGGGSGSDATPTLIGSDDDIGVVDLPWQNEDPYELRPSDSNESPTRGGAPVVLVDGSEEHLQFHRFLHTQRDLFASSAVNQHHNELDSLQNEATTRSHSSAASEAGSVLSVSHDGLIAGIGTWDDESEVEHFPGFFRKTPLRLSPQYEHCRGPSMSHLVTQDFSTLLNPIERIWRIPRPATETSYHLR